LARGRFYTTRDRQRRTGRKGPSRAASGRKGSGSPWPRRLVAVLMVLAVLWLSYGWLKGMVVSAMIDTTIAAQGTIEDSFTGDAFIVRREEVVVSPVSGQVSFNVQPGERVPVGALIATVVNTAKHEETQTLLAELDSELGLFLEGKAATLASGQERAGAIDQGLAELAFDLSRAASARDFDRAEALVAEMGQLRQEYQDITAQFQELQLEEDRLRSQRDQVAQELQQSAHELRAGKAGVVSFQFDGLETKLRPDALETWDTRGLSALKAETLLVEDGGIVEAGQPVYRIVSDTEVYVAVVTDNDSARLLLPERKVTVKFVDTDLPSVRGQVYYVGEQEKNGFSVVLLLCDDYISGFTSLRRGHADIVKARYEGIILPASSVVQSGGQLGVYIVQRDDPVFVPVSVLGRAADTVAVSGIKVGDEVVTNPSLIKVSGQGR